MDNSYLIMILLSLFILILILLVKYKKSQTIIRNIVNNSNNWLIDKTKAETQNYIDSLNKDIQNKEQLVEYQLQKLEEEKERANRELAAIQSNIEKQNRLNEQVYNYQKDQLERQLKLTQEERKKQLDYEISIYKTNSYNKANQELNESLIILNKQKEEKLSEISQIQQQLDDYKKKQEAINERILHEEQLRLQQDAHRIILSQEDKDDIMYLTSIIPKLRNHEIIYKLIWSEYLQKPFNIMIKNLFGNKVPRNVIYCIEQIDGNKKYIGKTKAEVSKRWTEHIKTSLTIGGVARSQIHDALYLHWDEFYFSVLEVVDNDSKLSEREKYYINFYETDVMGYNATKGG